LAPAQPAIKTGGFRLGDGNGQKALDRFVADNQRLDGKELFHPVCQVAGELGHHRADDRPGDVGPAHPVQVEDVPQLNGVLVLHAGGVCGHAGDKQQLFPIEHAQGDICVAYI